MHGPMNVIFWFFTINTADQIRKTRGIEWMDDVVQY
jgi:hypothetical protein